MITKLIKIGALLFGLLCCSSNTYAQDAGEAPKPPMAGDSASGVLQNTGPADVPDTRPVSGVQNLSLGNQSGSHSFLLPSFGVTSQVSLNPYGSTPGAQSVSSTTYLSGRLGLNKISARSELLIDYLTAGGFSNDASQQTSFVQSLDLAETLHWGRWSQMFGEQLTYLPASSFNFSGLGGLNNLGVNLGSAGSTPGFRQDIVPNQSIITNGARRIGNSVVAQTGYALGYRSSLNFFGAYGTLYFLDNGFQNSSTASFGAGYNYLLSPLNSMSISYGFSRLFLANSSHGADTHSVQVSFARRITGRLSFQVGAGPDVQIYQSPLAGDSTVISWALNSGLSYQVREVGMGFNYSHSLTGGSGVLLGAETDMFSGHIGRRFGSWEASLSAGYSRNQALPQTTVNGSGIATTGWFAGTQATRHFARYGSLFVSYNVSRQSGIAALCSVAACRTDSVAQTIALGYNWGFRPIILE